MVTIKFEKDKLAEMCELVFRLTEEEGWRTKEDLLTMAGTCWAFAAFTELMAMKKAGKLPPDLHLEIEELVGQRVAEDWIAAVRFLGEAVLALIIDKAGKGSYQDRSYDSRFDSEACCSIEMNCEYSVIVKPEYGFKQGEQES